MIYVITGANTYRAEQELAAIAKKLSLTPERINTSTLTDNGLADIMRGTSLFATKRLVVISQLSDDKSLWNKVGEWASAMTPDTILVLVEQKPDKRTKAYKSLIKTGKVIQCEPWSEYEYAQAEEWLRKLARQQGISLSQTQIQDMVVRAYIPGEKSTQRVIDQFQLAQALSALRNLDTVSDEAIATVLPPATPDTIFNVLEAAAHRDSTKLSQLLATLYRDEDPYMAFAVVMGQWAQLVAVALGGGSVAGIHPFVAKKLRMLAPMFTRSELAQLTHLAADLDAAAKTSQFSAWNGLERFLYAVAFR